jgi:hypothetical protein
MSQQETPPEAGGASSTPPAATTHISDDQLQELLYGYRSRRPRRAGEFDSAIIELELEAIRRGMIVDGPRERTPTDLALERCRYWLRAGHVDAAAHLMWDLSPLGAWRVFREVQRISVTSARLLLQGYLLFVIDTTRYGTEAALQRREMAEEGRLDEEEMDAYLRACLDAHFSDWMRDWPGDASRPDGGR